MDTKLESFKAIIDKYYPDIPVEVVRTLFNFYTLGWYNGQIISMNQMQGFIDNSAKTAQLEKDHTDEDFETLQKMLNLD